MTNEETIKQLYLELADIEVKRAIVKAQNTVDNSDWPVMKKTATYKSQVVKFK